MAEPPSARAPVTAGDGSLAVGVGAALVWVGVLAARLSIEVPIVPWPLVDGDVPPVDAEAGTECAVGDERPDTEGPPPEWDGPDVLGVPDAPPESAAPCDVPPGDGSSKSDSVGPECEGVGLEVPEPDPEPNPTRSPTLNRSPDPHPHPAYRCRCRWCRRISRHRCSRPRRCPSASMSRSPTQTSRSRWSWNRSWNPSRSRTKTSRMTSGRTSRTTTPNPRHRPRPLRHPRRQTSRHARRSGCRLHGGRGARPSRPVRRAHPRRGSAGSV